MSTSLTQKRWQIAPPPPSEFAESIADLKLNQVLAQVLYRRGFRGRDEIVSFLEPHEYSEDDNPFRMAGMVEAVYRLRMAVRNQEPIAVYGDFDCDGVTATVLLTGVLQTLGADAQPYIPNRVDEGYGLNSPALDSLARQGVKVVVTVDCGIRSVQEVIDGNGCGLDMIITDHHSVGPELPPALAVINPQREDCPYPEKRLAGVGVAYKLAQALFMEGQRRGIKEARGWRPEDWLDLVAIGTVADIMPLEGENRVLVRRGLNRLNHPQRPGLLALYEAAEIRVGQVTSTTIGFAIGPRINAAGRLRSAMLAYDLLAAPDIESARPLAKKLNDINRDRQEKTRQMQERAEEVMTSPASRHLLFAADNHFEQGIVGLVAGRLTEQYYRPSVVVHIGDDESHGSCRSIPEFHITQALDRCSDLLERYGGHAAAAGFTVRNQHISTLEQRLTEIAEDVLTGRELAPLLEIDAEISLRDITPDLMAALDRLEPTGEGNPQPIFATRGVTIRRRQVVGANGQHLKLRLEQDGAWKDAIAFRRGDQIENLPERVDIAYQLERDEWNGRQRIQLYARDIRPAEA
ncbi:MAG: single-stranded-DNA-specific exonuclease RecJ [Anaerolineae bacterium]